MEHQGTPAERQGTSKIGENPGKVVWRSAFQEKAPGVINAINVEKEVCLLLAGFEEWLRLLNYDATSYYNCPRRVGEFMSWLVESGHWCGSRLERLEIGSGLMEVFFEYLSSRPNQRYGGGLSESTLRNYLMSLRRFTRYLECSGLGRLDVGLSLRGSGLRLLPQVLSRSDIESLYEVMDDSALGQRDRVLLGIYYGCGLRKSEGWALELRDVLWDKSLLYVRKGKRGKSRYVPMVDRVRRDVLRYVQDGRRALLGKEVQSSLFISRQGGRLSSRSLYDRFKHLKKVAGIESGGGLHLLRHSIATHLLWGGMSLEYIRRFLGHSTLETTQLYTHLKAELND